MISASTVTTSASWESPTISSAVLVQVNGWQRSFPVMSASKKLRSYRGTSNTRGPEISICRIKVSHQ